MPKKVKKIKNLNPPNLLSNISGYDFSSNNSYHYVHQGDLKLWLRFNNNIQELVNYDPSNTPALAYNNNPSTSNEKVYSRKFKSFESTYAGSKSAEITFPGGSGNANVISFTNNGGTDDKPMTVSFWFKKPEGVSSFGEEYLFIKGKDDGNGGTPFLADSEYYALYFPKSAGGTGKLYFVIHDASADTSYEQRSTGDIGIEDDQWHMITLTYAGDEGATPTMKIYVDGALVSSSRVKSGTGTYQGMEYKSEKFYVGTKTTENFSTSGLYAEMALWEKELSIDEIKAIYYATYSEHMVLSGYLNLPPRVLIRDLDNRSKNYLYNRRLQDPEKLSAYKDENLILDMINVHNDDFKFLNDQYYTFSTGGEIRNERINV